MSNGLVDVLKAPTGYTSLPLPATGVHVQTRNGNKHVFTDGQDVRFPDDSRKLYYIEAMQTDGSKVMQMDLMAR